MNAALVWRAEFYDPNAPDKVVGHVDGDGKAVAQAEPPAGTMARFRLLTPPDIRWGDHVRYDNGEDPAFTAVVTRVGEPYASGTFNVDLSRDGQTQTVFCENCTVIFRPRTRPYKVGEALDILHTQDTLVGRAPGKTAKIYRGREDRCVLTFWLREQRVDVFTYDSARPGFDMKKVVDAANAWLFQEPVKVGDSWTEEINQGARDVEVTQVKRTRYRIEYEMPNAGMVGAWRRGTLIGKALYA